MTQVWRGIKEPDPASISAAGWVRVVLRGMVLGTVTFGCLGVLLLVRLIERPLFGARRPVTPFITQAVCRTAFVILGIGFSTKGEVLKGPGAVVANHSSWLDIFALNARKRIYFVSKAEVASWPAIGWLARSTGTVFIQRNPREAREHVDTFIARLGLGHKLLFFPEGTSSDGRRVLPFKPTLFEAFFDAGLRDMMSVQAVSVVYHGADGDPRQYGWWGDMDFGPHLLSTLAARHQGSVTIVYHPPVRVRDFADRKSMARSLEATVRSGLQDAGVLDA